MPVSDEGPRCGNPVNDPGDDFAPSIAGNYLYWSHNHMHDQIVVVPASFVRGKITHAQHPAGIQRATRAPRDEPWLERGVVVALGH